MKHSNYNKIKAFGKKRGIIFLLAGAFALAAGCGADKTGDSDDDGDSGGSVQSAGGGSSTTEANSSVNLDIQGTLPGAGLIEPEIEVTAPDGSVAGTLALSEAKVVLDEIRFRLPSEDSDDGDETEEESASLTQASDDDSTSSDDDGSETEDETEDDDDSKQYKFEGPFLVDLLSNTITPTPESIVIPAGLYKKIELRMHKVDDDAAAVIGLSEGDALYEKSVLVKGTFTPVDGTAVNVSMTYDLSEDFELSGGDGVSIGQSTVNDFVIAFRLAHWFEFDNTETNSDGHDFASLATSDIVLNKGGTKAEKDVRDVIQDNIKLSADFGKDKDGDGQLADSEDAESDAEEDEGEEDSTDS